MTKKKKKKKQDQAADAPWVKSSLDLYTVPILFALILFLRPFVDGLVWPISNSYFAWAMALIFAIWAGKSVLMGQAVRFGVPLVFLGLYALIALATVFSTIRVDLTYAALPILAVSIMSLILGMNVATTEAQRRIVFGAILAVCLCEAFYGIFHITYVLPQARAAVNENPALIEVVFPGAVITPELRHRLESNRAFGTFLFPNAFAAFLILVLPIAIASAWRAFTRNSDDIQDPDRVLPDMPKEWPAFAKILSIAFFGSVFIGVLLGAEYLIEYALRTDINNTSILRNSLVRYFFSIGGAVLIGIVPPIVCWTMGVHRGCIVLTRAAAPIIALITAYGVIISGTRGALLGIAGAFAVTGAIILWRRFGTRKIVAASAAALVIISALAAMMPTDAVAQNPNDLNIEGRAEDPPVMRFFTLIYRVHYWRVAWRAFMDNMAGGVGLGAYESAFHKYQYMGAPYAQMVHNDFLQNFAETGLFGGLAFLAFWVYFGFAGARAMLKADGWSAFLVVAGPYTGCIAFAIHQLFDFGFQNPSLSMIVYAIAGLTIASTAPRTLPASASRIMLIGCLVFAAIAAGWTSRNYIANRAEESLGNRTLRLAGADFLMIQTRADRQRDKPYSAGAITSFIGRSSTLNEFGFFGVPTEVPRQFRRIETSPLLPNNAAFFIDDWERGRAIAREAAAQWIDRYKEIDAAYPHRPMLARDIRQLYALLFRSTFDREERMKYIEPCMEWAYTMLERDPYSGYAMFEVAWTHWMAASVIEDDQERLDGLLDSLEYFRKSVELLSAEPFIYYEYSVRIDDCRKLVDESDPELKQKLDEEYAWAREQEALALKKSPFSLTGETHADILRKWPELERTR